MLDPTIPADGNGIDNGVKVSELAGHIRQLKSDINDDFATIEFVNKSLAATTLNLFLTDTSSSEVGGYYEMVFSETGASSSSLTANSVSDGDLLWAFVSPQFEVADQISAGLYVTSIWVEQDSNKTVTITVKMYKRDGSGTETLLLESSTSDEIPKDIKTQIIMSGFLENDEDISDTDRIVLKFYANVSGGGGAPNITLYMEGTDDSRLAMRTPTSVITSKIFDADGDSYITTEETADEDIIRIYTGGSERVTIGSNKLITIVSKINLRDNDAMNAANCFQTFSFYGTSSGKWWYLGRINNIDGSATGGERGYVDIQLYDGRDIGDRAAGGTKLIAVTRNGGLTAEHRHYGSLAYNSSNRSYFDIRNDGSNNFHVYLWMTAYAYGRIIIYTNNNGFWTPVEGSTPTGTQVYATNTASNMGSG